LGPFTLPFIPAAAAALKTFWQIKKLLWEKNEIKKTFDRLKNVVDT
jgi:hypothetical protein